MNSISFLVVKVRDELRYTWDSIFHLCRRLSHPWGVLITFYRSTNRCGRKGIKSLNNFFIVWIIQRHLMWKKERKNKERERMKILFIHSFIHTYIVRWFRFHIPLARSRCPLPDSNSLHRDFAVHLVETLVLAQCTTPHPIWAREWSSKGHTW